jgi:hypothetical protein
VPDGTSDGYRLAAEVGCSCGCDPAEVAWWWLWKLGELPAQAPDQRQQRYARGAVRKILVELQENLNAAEVRHRAYRIGQLTAAAELDLEIVAAALKRTIHPSALHAATQALTAGRARPARLP